MYVPLRVYNKPELKKVGEDHGSVMLANSAARTGFSHCTVFSRVVPVYFAEE